MNGAREVALIEASPVAAPTDRRAKPRRPVWRVGLVAMLAWLLVASVALAWPTAEPWPRTAEFAGLASAVAAVLGMAAFAGPLLPDGLGALRRAGPWLVVLALLVLAWEVATAKLGLLPMPFFVPPQSLLEVYLDDWPRLGESVLHSVWLLARGYAIGAAAGFLVGLAMGWWQAAGYWLHPILRFVGPLPATAWLPLAFFAFPSSGSASVFLIALASGFPVAVLTWSGIAGVNRAFYDIARTMGASERFLVLKVAVPGAMPHVFVGLFMGLGASFSVLVVAEMMGVKAGLGWYLQWAQGWAAYANMYAALLVMALMCSGLITLLFRVRDRLLAWQKGLVRW